MKIKILETLMLFQISASEFLRVPRGIIDITASIDISSLTYRSPSKIVSQTPDKPTKGVV